MALPDVTVGGKLLADPVLTSTEDGEPVTDFPVVSANFKRDATGKWVEEAECRLNVTARGRYAENAAESLRKGDLALIRGQLHYGPDEGHHLVAYSVAVDLRFRVTRHSKEEAKAQPQQ